jgi:hypothetical protein
VSRLGLKGYKTRGLKCGSKVDGVEEVALGELQKLAWNF